MAYSSTLYFFAIVTKCFLPSCGRCSGLSPNKGSFFFYFQYAGDNKMCYSYMRINALERRLKKMLYVFIFIIGIVCGAFISNLLLKKHSIGTLRIDNSDPDGPYLFLELSTNISSFNKKKQVILNVLDESYLPQK